MQTIKKQDKKIYICKAGFQCFKTQKLHKKFTKIPLFLLPRRCSMGVGKTKRFLFGGGTYEKKSHISLARYIVNNMEDNDLKKHKLSFTSEVSCRTLSHLSSISAMRWTELTRISDAILSAFPRAGNWWRRKRAQVLHGSWTDQPLSGRLFYLSSQ